MLLREENRKKQADFKSGFSTVDYTAHRKIAKIPKHLLFVDFNKVSIKWRKK